MRRHFSSFMLGGLSTLALLAAFGAGHPLDAGIGRYQISSSANNSGVSVWEVDTSNGKVKNVVDSERGKYHLDKTFDEIDDGQSVVPLGRSQ